MRPWALDILLCLCLLALGLRLFALKNTYTHIFSRDNFTAQEAGIRYTVWNKSYRPGTMYIGDLLGTNLRSVKQLQEFIPPPDLEAVVIATIHPVYPAEITEENFFDAIADPNGVVLVDNFCFPGWQGVRSHAWYQGTSLSPGPFCFSEPQTLLVDRLIKQYDVRQVKIYADNKIYTHLIRTFLKYLDHIKIKYEIVYAP